MKSYQELVREIEKLTEENRKLRADCVKTPGSSFDFDSIPEFAWAGNLGRWSWDYTSGNVHFNPLKVEVLGYDYESFPRHVDAFTSLIHPDDFAATMKNMRDHLTGVTPAYETEYRIRCNDGSYRWFYDRGLVIRRDGFGKPLEVAGIVFDISDRKKNEEELRERLSHFENTGSPSQCVHEIIPVCASCKKLRDENGTWLAVDDYFSRKHSIQFTHSVCPSCVTKLYPELDISDK